MASCKPLYTLILISVSSLFVSQAVMAATAVRDLGTAGATYPVVEPDLVTELKNQALRQHTTRDTVQLQDQLKTYQPANLHTLPHATADRSFLVNMNYTVTQDVVDGEGTIIYPRGFIFNPLDYLRFPGGLVVIDGADPLHITWFQNTNYAQNDQARLLLSDGSAYELSRQLKRSVFYLTTDIAERLQLAAVPSVVLQEDRNVRVHEIKLVREVVEKRDENQ